MEALLLFGFEPGLVVRRREARVRRHGLIFPGARLRFALIQRMTQLRLLERHIQRGIRLGTLLGREGVFTWIQRMSFLSNLP